MIEVTQADRDAAVRIMSDRWNAKHRQEVAAGKHDGWIPVQECARHRIASQKVAIRAAIEAEARDEIDWFRIVKRIRREDGATDAILARGIINAIRALSVEQIMKGMGG